MPIVIKKGEDFEPIPAGIHVARCYRIVDLGTQPDQGFGAKHKLVITWEVPGQLIKIDGKDMPMSVSEFYGFTLGKKSKLKDHLQNWRGKAFTDAEREAFDISVLLGKPCQLNIIHTEEGRARVSTVLGIPKGMEVPAQVNPSVEFSVSSPDMNVYNKLPEWLQKMVTLSEEWKAQFVTKQPQAPKATANGPIGQRTPEQAAEEMRMEALAAATDDDDVPF